MFVLIIILLLIGFVLLVFFRGRWFENVSAIVGVGFVGLAALVIVFIGVDFFVNGEQIYSQSLWTWMSVGDFNIGFNLVLDGLSLIMFSVVIGVGFFIYMYVFWYMRGEEGYFRFFVYINLFIVSMVVLVFVDNLLLMYFGWEGVGLCFYLLIGFYYIDSKNGVAVMKAFVVIRVGDVFFVFVLFIFYNELGILNFREMVELVLAYFVDGNNMLMWATLMLLGGAVGKFAQLSLQIWFVDAMAGSTFVFALIYVVIMVIAGVYLIVRIYGLFLMTSEVLYLVGIVGAVTLLLVGFVALVQIDIKRVFVYFIMSQIGYMFFAFGVQVWDAAIFYLMIYAFFKALLFLVFGFVILVCYYEQNIFKMGGLRKFISLVYFCFLVGGVVLSVLSLVIAGFFSKDEIFAGAMANGYINLMVVGLVGAFMISFYIFRMIFIVFYGKE